jgi:hypothetical protein
MWEKKSPMRLLSILTHNIAPLQVAITTTTYRGHLWANRAFIYTTILEYRVVDIQ